MNETQYNQRLKRIMEASDNKEADRVPIMALSEYYNIGYAGKTISECIADPKVEIEAFGEIFKKIYYDGAFFSCISHPINVNKVLGSDSYFVSEDGITLQHKEHCPMTPDEYEMLASDPYGYLQNVFFKKKYVNLQGTQEQTKAVITNSLAETLNFAQKITDAGKYFKEELGIPVVAAGLSFAPMDVIFDYLRGFEGTLLDIRRHREPLKAAIKALVEVTTNFSVLGAPQLPSFPWSMTPLHIPPYINDKNFKELYWPFYKEYLMNIYEKGGKVCAFPEGKWGDHFDYLQELPDNLLMVIVEEDIVKIKKKLAGKVCVIGGMDLGLLRFGTKQQCIDHAKYIIDECAPGGGFMFSTDKELISPKDANPENLKAVNEFVHEYGVY